MTLQGAGRDVTQLTMRHVIGPAWWLSPSTTLFPVQPNAYAGGNAAVVRRAPVPAREQDCFLELREYGSGCDWDGLPEFSFECVIKKGSTPGVDGPMIVASYGRRFSTEVNNCFSLLFTPGGAIIWSLTTTAGTQQVTGSFPDTTEFHVVECSYDGTAMRMFIDGKYQGDPTKGPQPQTGTLVQKPWSRCCSAAAPRSTSDGFWRRTISATS